LSSKLKRLGKLLALAVPTALVATWLLATFTAPVGKPLPPTAEVVPAEFAQQGSLWLAWDERSEDVDEIYRQLI